MPAPASADRLTQLESVVMNLEARLLDLEGAMAVIVQHFQRGLAQKTLVLLPPDANDKGS